MSVDIPPDVQVQVTTAVTWLWDKYGKSIVDKAAERAKEEVKWRVGLEKYYASLFERVGFVRILGRREAEPLQNVFTHVNVLDKTSAERWYDVNQLIADFRPRDLQRLERTKRMSGEASVAEYPKLFILGKPGAGKTTFLKHTALRAINGEIDKVPIFVTLKEVVDREMEIVPFIEHQFAVHRFPEPTAFVARLLEKGDAIVLFDGLDEVNLADNRRGRMIDRLNDFVYRYGECPILLTCRVAATDYTFTQFEYVEMADFDQEQIGRYIDRWFVYDEEKRRNCRLALLENSANEAVRELAQVPLLLALLCLVFEERNEIPPMRYEIYEEATRALLSKWDASRNINRDTLYTQLSTRRKQQMLALLAAKTFEAGVYFLKEHRVVQLIEDYLQGVPGLKEPNGRQVLQVMEAQHGLLVERARGIHSFSHLTLQEYFTARYIVDNERRGTVERLMTHVGDDRWNEVFILVAGMLDDATEFGGLYLRAAHQLIADDEMLVDQLRWAEQKRKRSPSFPYRVAAIRAFLIHFAHAVHLRLDFTVNFTLGNVQERILDQLVEDYYNNRALDHKPDRALAFDLELALDFIRACDQDLARVLELGSKLELIRLYELNPLDVFDLAFQVAEYLKLTELQVELEKLKSTSPIVDFGGEKSNTFASKLDDILESCSEAWDPYQQFVITDDDADRWKIVTNYDGKEVVKWEAISEEQWDILDNYLQANILLARCLQVAYVPEREVLLDKFLLPPEQW
jgi:hypothetical protein